MLLGAGDELGAEALVEAVDDRTRMIYPGHVGR